MDPGEKDKAVEWFRGKVSSVCPSCHEAAGFSVLDGLITPPLAIRGIQKLGDELVPLVGLICNNCYNIRFYSAVMIGVIGPEPK
ncbi:MAG: hypothetical protein U0804_10795 [Gemmataceae bacterium]